MILSSFVVVLLCDLVLVQVVYWYGSFNSVVWVMYISLFGLLYQVQKVEQVLGGLVFECGGWKIVFIVGGCCLLEQIDVVLVVVEYLQQVVCVGSVVFGGELCLGVLVLLGLYLLLYLIVLFLQYFVGVCLSLFEGKLCGLLCCLYEGEFDVVLVLLLVIVFSGIVSWLLFFELWEIMLCVDYLFVGKLMVVFSQFDVGDVIVMVEYYLDGEFVVG